MPILHLIDCSVAHKLVSPNSTVEDSHDAKCGGPPGYPGSVVQVAEGKADAADVEFADCAEGDGLLLAVENIKRLVTSG